MIKCTNNDKVFYCLILLTIYNVLIFQLDDNVVNIFNDEIF